MERIKLQTLIKIHLKSDIVGQIMNTETPLLFRKCIVRRDNGTESVYCWDTFTVYGLTQNSSYGIPNKSFFIMFFKTFKGLQYVNNYGTINNQITC